MGQTSGINPADPTIAPGKSLGMPENNLCAFKMASLTNKNEVLNIWILGVSVYCLYGFR